MTMFEKRTLSQFRGVSEDDVSKIWFAILSDIGARIDDSQGGDDMTEHMRPEDAGMAVDDWFDECGLGG